MAKAAMTADCFWSAGYLATSRSISLSASWLSMVLSVNLTEHDVHGADDGYRISNHVTLGNLVHGGEMHVTRCADLQAVRLVGAIGNCVDAELTLRMFNGRIGLARRHVHAFGEQLEVVNQLFHVALHVLARRRGKLVIVGNDRTRVRTQPGDALLDDAIGLAHLEHAHQVTVVGVAIDADGD